MTQVIDNITKPPSITNLPVAAKSNARPAPEAKPEDTKKRGMIDKFHAGTAREEYSIKPWASIKNSELKAAHALKIK
jgi:hypothetical protein